MNLSYWFRQRGVRFVFQRLASLLDKYGLSPAKATVRIEANLATLARFGCRPTFFTPGAVVDQHVCFIQDLQAAGAEIALHGYQHVDLSSLPLAEAKAQLTRALTAFSRHGLEARGLRCPYLGCPDALLDDMPAGLFRYSSNRALWFDVTHTCEQDEKSLLFSTLRRFYHPGSSAEICCVPWSRSNMIEIPVCVPDDLQLHQGLGLDAQGIAQAWFEILRRTYERGELFNLIFHPELGAICNSAFEVLLQEAVHLTPKVWIARLRDICDWWQEKAGFTVDSLATPTGLQLAFSCSSRATILVRGLATDDFMQPWYGAYMRLQARRLGLPSGSRPFVGAAADAGPAVAFLREQGYIVDTTGAAARCAVYLDAEILSRLNQVQLVDYIEVAPGPLVRYGRWPDGARSALCITGDLDALTLLDYAGRLAGK